MRKVLFLVAAMLISALSFGQSGVLNLKSTTTGKTLDTVTNAGTRTQRLDIKGYQDVVTVQATLTKISGTAGGTATLYGSVDGTGWTAIGSAYTVTNVASQTNSWSINPSIWQKYQITYVGTGTMAVSFTTPVLTRAK